MNWKKELFHLVVILLISVGLFAMKTFDCFESAVLVGIALIISNQILEN